MSKMNNNNKLNYKIIGEGYPVVFLHGFLESLFMWENLQLETLGIQVILIDLPGHGDSLNEDDNEPTMEFMANKVEELILELAISSFSIVGHSMGGYVALSLKHRFSLDREINTLFCNKVILLNSNFWEDSEVKKNDRLKIAKLVFKNKELLIHTVIPNLFSKPDLFATEIEKLIEDSLKMDSHSISYASLAMRNRVSFKELLAQFPEDFFVIQGELDSIVPFQLMEKELAGTGVLYAKKENVGHMMHIESPLELTKLLLLFLAN